MASWSFDAGYNSDHPTWARLKIQYMGGLDRSFLTRRVTDMSEAHTLVTEDSVLQVLVFRPRDSEKQELLQVGTYSRTTANSLQLYKVCLWKDAPSQLSEALGLKAERDPEKFFRPNEYGILGYVKYDQSVLSE